MISFNEKGELRIGMPTGVGVKNGGNSQFTWLQYVQGVNQQDSNGGVIGNNGWTGITWDAPVIIGSGVDGGGVFIGTLTGFIASSFSTVGISAGGASCHGSGLYSGPAANLIITVDSFSAPPFTDNGIQVIQDAVSIATFGNGDLALSPLVVPISAGVASLIEIQGFSNGLSYSDGSASSANSLTVTITVT